MLTEIGPHPVGSCAVLSVSKYRVIIAIIKPLAQLANFQSLLATCHDLCKDSGSLDADPMLHTPPKAMTDASAPCARDGDSILDMVGWNTAPVRQAEVDRSVAPNAKIWGKAGGGMTLILPDDIPSPDDGKTVPYEVPKQRKLFVHKPVITRRIGDKVEVVTGPVKPVVPHTDETTADGWKRYFAAADAATAATVEKAKAVAAERKAFFQARDDKDEDEWQARCKKAEEKGRPLPKRPVKAPPPPGWEMYIKDPVLMGHIIDSRGAAQRKERIRRFKGRSGMKFADREYAAFTEEFEHEDGTLAPALRGWLGLVSLSLFSGALEKGRGVTYGNDKTAEFSGMDRIWALDSSHAVLDKCRCSAFVVDLDGWWPSLKVLRKLLRKLLPREFMPNITTYRGREKDGAGVENPHLVWLLPPGSRVLGFGNKKQRNLFEMIQKAIVNLLIPIGADGGHTNVAKTKCPLAPGWSIEVCDDYFQTMDAWRNFLPTINVDRRDMIRRTKLHKAEKQSGAEPKESLAIWNDGITYRSLEIKVSQKTQDQDYLAAVRKCRPNKVLPFVDWLYHPANGVVTKRLIDIHGDTKAVRAVISAQREFVLELCKTPDEIGEFYNCGRDAKQNEDLKPLPPTATAAERKARRDLIKSRAGTSTQWHKKDGNCGLIAEAIERRLSAGVPIVESEIVKEVVKAGICSRATAYARFDEVLLIVQQAARYQVHPQNSEQAQPSQPVEPSSVTPSEEPANLSEEPVAVDSVNVPAKPVRNPVKSTVYPAWVVDKDSLTLWEEACRLRDDWAVAVAASRSAAARRRPKDGADFAADPTFRALVLDRSSWAGHRRH